MKQVNFYIDRFNLYHAIDAKKDPSIKWICYKTLAESFLRNDETLGSVYLFTAVLTWDPEKQARHVAFIRAQEARGVIVIKSKFKKSDRACRFTDSRCRQYEEKQTDVAIACTMLRDALCSGVSRQVLISADSDQVPTLQMIRAQAPQIEVTLAAPPGRETAARELGALARTRKPITVGRLQTCRLPRNVRDASGKTVATMPALYAETGPAEGDPG